MRLYLEQIIAQEDKVRREQAVLDKMRSEFAEMAQLQIPISKGGSGLSLPDRILRHLAQRPTETFDINSIMRAVGPQPQDSINNALHRLAKADKVHRPEPGRWTIKVRGPEGA